ncbi:MAG TPA: sulfatase [Kofleriaceae bacterium]
MILVDTLRADHLSVYGYPRDTSPRLAAMASEGILFKNHYSQAGCTWPSANSILTSRPPEFFLAGRRKTGMGIPEDSPSLAELLERRGFSTAAVSASPVVRNTPSKLNRQGGFGRGFQSFDETCPDRSAACVNNRALKALDGMREPFFLYLHYLEPHQDYQPPAWHERRFATSRPDKRWVRLGDIRPISRQIYDRQPGPEYDENDLRFLVDLYDEEILFFDARLGELLDDLERRGVADRTAVVLLSDHGEELLDHGHVGHCRDLAYESLVRTPLVMRLPAAPRGVVRQGLSLNLDLVPTLLDYLEVPYPDGAFDGHSLRPLIESSTRVNRLAYATQGRARVVSDGALKLRYDIESETSTLYDLAADPGERHDLSAVRPADRDRLAAALHAWMEEREGDATPSERLRRAQESEAELKALGYL